MPIRNSSTARAHWRPSRIAQTTSDWPRRMSPAAKSFGDRGLVVERRWPRRCRAGRASTPDCSTMPGWRGPRKPIASSTRSAFSSNAAARDLLHRPCGRRRPSPTRRARIPAPRPCRPCRRRAWSAPRSRGRSLPPATRRCAASAASRARSAPCSRCSGGCGMISSWVTEAAPWRFEVPMQSEPVSPPPITTTCLPLAVSVPRGRGARLVVAGDALVLLGQEIHREVDAGELAARHFEVARPFGAAGQRDRVVAVEQRLDRQRRRRPRRRCGTRRPRPPSARMRRSIRCFSILKSGMP